MCKDEHVQGQGRGVCLSHFWCKLLILEPAIASLLARLETPSHERKEGKTPCRGQILTGQASPAPEPQGLVGTLVPLFKQPLSNNSSTRRLGRGHCITPQGVLLLFLFLLCYLLVCELPQSSSKLGSVLCGGLTEKTSSPSYGRTQPPSTRDISLPYARSTVRQTK